MVQRFPRMRGLAFSRQLECRGASPIRCAAWAPLPSRTPGKGDRVKVDIELTRSSDAEDLTRSLTAQGIPADLLPEPGHVEATAEDLAFVGHAVEDWTAERGLPYACVPASGMMTFPPAYRMK